MVGPSHAVVGLASVVLIGRTLQIVPDALGLFLVLIGCLSPDIDGSGSITKPSRLLGGLIPRGMGALIDGITTAISRAIQSLVGHRTLFHWPALALCIIGAGYAFEMPWLCWFGVGYLSHILADATTNEGVPLLAPIHLEKVSLQWMRTGSRRELFVVIGIAILTVFFGFALLPENLQSGFRDLAQLLKGR
jgi:membrane-bound metal-dependent hydrolase YbcI (DUF457 family)